MVEGSTPKKLGLVFQAAAVKKPLLSVHRVVERGNKVCFGPGEKDNYIECPRTGDKFFMTKSGSGSYILKVDFLGGGRGEITVDSGAEENVCPAGWAPQFQVKSPNRKMNFRGANGSEITHYGQKEVECTCPF